MDIGSYSDDEESAHTLLLPSRGDDTTLVTAAQQEVGHLTTAGT